MRFPRLRFPEVPDWMSGIIDRSVLLYAAYTIVLFLVFLVVTFPHQALIERIIEMTKNPAVAVDVTHPRFAWLNGYELDGVRLTALPLREGVPPLLEWTRLRIRPDYSALIRGNFRSCVISGELYGGHAEGFVSDDNGTINAHLEWSGLNLGRYRTITAAMDQGQVNGLLSGSWTMQYAKGGQAIQGNGSATLNRGALENAKISGFTIPNLKVAEAVAKVTLKDRRLEIQEINATGDDLNIQASGTVDIQNPPPNSILNIRVIPQKLPESIKPFLAFLPHRGNPRDNKPITISGMVSHPTIR